ncbi:hypothetical protein NUW54_g6713 [Trametes sanguinea]|uniref:Uncharacterized protein n=1 Tax=Trametes sanguinea TaxID=158606 RepID=A0ACC1PTA4_9APHY|nr:hypothetical protein NUW54_g6713 [Trametes sanguinea]
MFEIAACAFVPPGHRGCASNKLLGRYDHRARAHSPEDERFHGASTGASCEVGTLFTVADDNGEPQVWPTRESGRRRLRWKQNVERACSMAGDGEAWTILEMRLRMTIAGSEGGRDNPREGRKLYIMYGMADRQAAQMFNQEFASSEGFAYDDCWSWDIKEERWQRERVSGNYPCPRAEMSVCYVRLSHLRLQ